MTGPVRAVLGIDLGTSYFKAGLFSEDGRILALGRIAVDAETGVRGRFELSAPRFQELLRTIIGQALLASGLPSAAIQAVSYSSQANSFLLLDRDARPLSPIILWQDRRVEEVPPELARLHSRPDYLSVTGLDMIGSLQCPSKLLWFRDQEPETWGGTRMVMAMSDYLTYLMTGERAGDSGTASLLGLWDLVQGKWWGEALEDLGFDADLFSRLHRPGTVIGKVDRGAAGLFGIPEGIPFAVGSLDHHMAAIGSGVGSVASLMESNGTVIACFAESAAFAPRPGCAMGPGLVAGAPYYNLAFHDSGAVVLEWYRKRYAESLSFDELAGLAEKVPLGSEGLVCLPLADTCPGKEGFVAAGPEHGHGHFARAIMESIAGELGILLEKLRGADLPDRVIATGGGAGSDLWLHIMADLTGCTMVTTGFAECACAGSAMLAAVAAGWFATPAEASASWVRTQKTIYPDHGGHGAYAAWYERYLSLRKTGNTPN